MVTMTAGKLLAIGSIGTGIGMCLLALTIISKYSLQISIYLNDIHKNNDSKPGILTKSITATNNTYLDISLKKQPDYLRKVNQEIPTKTPYPKIPNGLMRGGNHDKRLFYYHTRKTGGSSIEWMLNQIAKYHNYDIILSEGRSLYNSFLHLPRTISFISLRHPVDRIISLYWYEHVMWWHGPGKDTSKCRTFSDWFNAWRDGSAWKQKIIASDPSTTYVEVENYFIKSLIGWDGSKTNSTLGGNELSQAKEILMRFDVILLTKLLSAHSQQEYLVKMFPNIPRFFQSYLFKPKNVRSNSFLRKSLEHQLIPFKAKMRSLILSVNQLDMELYAFAEELVIKRLASSKNRNNIATFNIDSETKSLTRNSSTLSLLNEAMLNNMGVNRPALHKGPV